MRSPRTEMKSNPHSLQLEKARTQQRRPNTAKKKKKVQKNEGHIAISQTVLEGSFTSQ